MFNSKRIIFLIGLLSIVALTGALLAGPAFAAPKAKGYVCHYAAAETLVTVVDDVTITTHEPERWGVINVSMSSVPDHEANHFDGHGQYDFYIDDTDLNEDNDRADCDALMTAVNTVDVD